MFKNLDYYLDLKYKINLEAIPEEDGGGWLATCPELEGCMSDGETPDEAIANLQDAKKEWFEFCLNKELSIPEPKFSSSLDDFSGKFTLRVSKSTHKKLVEKTIEENVSLNSLVNGYIHEGLIADSYKKEVKQLFEQQYQRPEVFITVSEVAKKPKGLLNEVTQSLWGNIKQQAQFNRLNKYTSQTHDFLLTKEDDLIYE
ncbi:type II toxin-antitoxin system HicB family antitoxin [Bacillus subtilis]|uniref:type II toxin-antitoxin system HicB family antitoxin n=1 Tax=Bacillus subtilis TaxID=1423 RepID=UPI000345929C|nr:toxin-antitoxin system HicB family antitoxin [Bacillus subtilis]MBO3767002.1 type II toxin-antitoxin system HicB family antitoxin [Bacillus subtilis]